MGDERYEDAFHSRSDIRIRVRGALFHRREKRVPEFDHSHARLFSFNAIPSVYKKVVGFETL
jgi:hypothetical protein